MSIKSFVAACAAALVFGAFTVSSASAAPVICDNATASAVSPLVQGYPAGNNGCQYDPTVRNAPTSSPLVVNEVGFFGVSDWIFDYKHDFPNETEGANALGFSLLAGSDSMSGSFSFTPTTLADKVLLVFKGPNQANPNALIAYLIDLPAVLLDGAGTYASMFRHHANDSLQDISNLSVYYTAGIPPAPIPLPPAALLLIGGIAALRTVTRRKATRA